jgi:glucose/arabinose dehydrogenase
MTLLFTGGQAVRRTLACVFSLALAAPIAILLAGAPQQNPAPAASRGGAAQREPQQGGGRGGGGLGASLPPGGAKPQPDKLKVAKGFEISIYADGVTGARSMALASDGTVFVGTQQRGVVYAIVNRDNDGRADQVLTIASGLNTPNGVAFRNGALYVAELNRIVRFNNILDTVKAKGTASTPVVITDKLPSDRQHGWKYLAFGPDGLLYVPVGAPCNICERPDPYASILRMKPDGSGLETFARGVRNTVGFTWHPDTREMWFTDNGRDMLGDERPNDELNHAQKAALHFGFPYCHEGAILDPEFGKGKSCSEYTPPAQRLGPHVAALGLAFYTGTAFPAEYRKQLFIVNHGSWNRGPGVGHTGYRLMVARIQNNKVESYEPFVEGWLETAEGASVPRQAWGRPVDVLVMPDGALLVSDDRANVIYRIANASR